MTLRRLIEILTFLVILTSLTSCGQGLTKSKNLKEWTVDEYTITYSRKIGPVGPHYFQYDVYKNDKYLSYAAYIIDNDSCMLRFREKSDYYVDFNLCEKTKNILLPDKNVLDFSRIDSITIRPYNSIRLVPKETYTAPFYDTIVFKDFDSTFTKKLNKKEVKIFVNKWNKSKANGYNRLGKTYHYLLTVYSKGTTRQIKTLNNFFTENEKWSYESKDDNYFDKLWMKIE